MTEHRRIAPGDRFSHNTVQILSCYATCVVNLHFCIDEALRDYNRHTGVWDTRAAIWARVAVRAARLLVVREDLR